MVETVVDASAAVCAMHMQGTPQTMQDAPRYTKVVAEIHRYLQERRDALQSAGISADRICLDPGVGFGKTHQHNLTLLANCHGFHELGCPLLVGASRKGFIAKILRDKTLGDGILGDSDANRLFGTIGVMLSLAVQGVQILRVHDIRAVREALLLFEACGGIDGLPAQLDESAS